MTLNTTLVLYTLYLKERGNELFAITSFNQFLNVLSLLERAMNYLHNKYNIFAAS